MLSTLPVIAGTFGARMKKRPSQTIDVFPPCSSAKECTWACLLQKVLTSPGPISEVGCARGSMLVSADGTLAHSDIGRGPFPHLPGSHPGLPHVCNRHSSSATDQRYTHAPLPRVLRALLPSAHPFAPAPRASRIHRPQHGHHCRTARAEGALRHDSHAHRRCSSRGWGVRKGSYLVVGFSV